MVRGYERCSHFCQGCKQDCICSACHQCHTCRLRIIAVGTSQCWKENLPVCKTYKHDCLADTPKGDETTPAAGKSCWESFVRLRGTSPARPMKFEKFSQSEIVSIHLAQEKRTYNIHKSLLFAESLFFREMLLSGMSESKKGMVSLGLEVDTSLAFEKFMQWCYFGYYVYDTNENIPLLSIDAAVYIFAERIICMDLKKFALKQAQTLCNSRDKAAVRANLSILPDTIEFIYENTSSSVGQGLDTGCSNQPDPKLLFRDKPETTRAVEYGGPREDFRRLLASVSARHLVQLRKEPSFMKVHRSLSDFAADVLFFVEQSSDGPAKQSCILS
ncbi:uncharacterized protein DFL_003838 [Arthrobotrys flagrans]|uniref:BTB domain-containing protein n=1 Tax=Arthrobotrys flagrans TaxID=97331 RepID=A0A437A399_ARTFL|nr:hypothetical protein DFL_003838 [Arthrobotrys flagrans]